MNYKLTDESIKVDGVRLFRIEATVDMPLHDVSIGEKGGFVQSIDHLRGNAWVGNNACVYGNARVSGNACVYGNARVSGNAYVYGNARVSGNAWIDENARVSDNALVKDNARVFGEVIVVGDVLISGEAYIISDAWVRSIEDYIVFKNWWSSGRYFTWTRSNNMWKVGCFYGTGEELVKKAYQDSKKSGDEYKRVVEYVNAILTDEKKEKENQ